ncbi:protein FAM228B-like [Discoglossus pictus]
MSPVGRDHMKDGVITLQAEEIPKDLQLDPEQHRASKFRKSTMESDSLSLSKKTIRSSIRSSTAPRTHSSTCLRKAENWLTHKPNVQLLTDEDSQELNITTHSVLDTENLYNQTLDEYLKQTDSLELRRKEMQHRKWTELVQVPLQKTIENYVNVQSSEDIERRRRAVLAQYLKYCNKRGASFMYDFDPSEYNPYILQLGKHLQVPTPPFPDPLLRQIQNKLEEERITLMCDTGRLYSAKEVRDLKLPHLRLGRQAMNAVEWVKTPVGYIESEIRQKNRQKIKGTLIQESNSYQTWNIAQKKKFPKRKTSPIRSSKPRTTTPTVQIITL